MFCRKCGAEIICNADSHEDGLTGSYEGYLELGVFEFKCNEFDKASDYFDKAIKRGELMQAQRRLNVHHVILKSRTYFIGNVF